MVTLTRLYDAYYRDNFTKRIWLVANVHPHLKQPDEEGPFKCEEPGCEQTSSVSQPSAATNSNTQVSTVRF